MGACEAALRLRTGCFAPIPRRKRLRDFRVAPLRRIVAGDTNTRCAAAQTGTNSADGIMGGVASMYAYAYISQ